MADPDDPDALRIAGRGIPGERAKEELAKKPITKRRKEELLQEAQRVYWTALPGLVKALVDGASKGQIAPLKMLVDLGGLERGAMARHRPRATKSLESALMDELKRGRDQAATEGECPQQKRAHDSPESAEGEPRTAADGGGLDGV